MLSHAPVNHPLRPVYRTIAALSAVVTVVVGVALGVVSAVRGGRIGRVVDVLSLVGYALPGFWFALTMVTAYLLLVFLTYSKVDPGWSQAAVVPQIHNWGADQGLFCPGSAPYQR